MVDAHTLMCRQFWAFQQDIQCFLRMRVLLCLFCCCLLCSAVAPPEMLLSNVSTMCVDLSQCLSSKKAVKISSKALSLFDPSAVPHHWMDSEHRKQHEAPGLRSPGYAWLDRNHPWKQRSPSLVLWFLETIIV